LLKQQTAHTDAVAIHRHALNFIHSETTAVKYRLRLRIHSNIQKHSQEDCITWNQSSSKN